MAEDAESLPDCYLKPDVSQLQVPIFAQSRDVLNPYVLEREVPLQEALEKHTEKAAMKKGVKDQAILCGVEAGSSVAHEDSHEHRPSV
jgi:hypothetical protein